MARDKVIREFRIQPVDGDDGSLAAITIQPTTRTARLSDDGKVLAYGWTVDDGAALEIPVGKLADLIRELADWPIYYASGEYVRDQNL